MEKLDSQQAQNVLSAWLALEVLSPQSSRKVEEFTNGDKSAISYLQDGELPWDKQELSPKPNTKIFYHIVLGTINLKKAFSALNKVYSETNFERPSIPEEAIIATITVDQKGIPLRNEGSIALSSFAWGLAEALKRNLKDLDKWPSVEGSIISSLWRIIDQKNDDSHTPSSLSTSDTQNLFYSDGVENQETIVSKNNAEAPLTFTQELPEEKLSFANTGPAESGINKKTLEAIRQYLVDIFCLPLEMVTEKQFSVRIQESVKKKTKPQSLLLNSFYLEDLFNARYLIGHKTAPRSLLRYLGVTAPSKRHDILHDNQVLENLISPQNIPNSKWPSEGRHPLVLLQQAAVNLSMTSLDITRSS